MRTLHRRIVLTCMCTLLASIAATVIIFATVGQTRSRSNISRTVSLQVGQAALIYDRDGPEGLAAFLKKLDQWFASTHYLVDANGRDVLTGEDRSGAIPRREPISELRRSLRSIATYLTGAVRTGTAVSEDGRYRILSSSKPWQSFHSQLPYLIGLIVVMSVVYSLVAIQIATAVRKIAATAERFGEGDLKARVRDVYRKDDLGELGATFNNMADRICALLAAERRLLQDVSHELRSPLAKLAFAAELARTAPDRHVAVDQINKQIACLTDLVSSLLQVTQMDGIRPSPHRQGVSVAAVVAEVSEICALQVRERRCVLRLAGSPSRLIAGDQRLIVRALDNVVRNAIHYSPEGGEIEITTYDNDAGDVLFEVRDYGPGVPDAMLSQIFQPFFRVDDSRQSSSGGVGLGLSIVQRIVHEHHGWIHATNAGPGLRVTFAVPAWRAEGMLLSDSPRTAA
jgi:signal transduction histidine kinase